ncbi:hypothetical protein BGZ68_002238, partial [Mortierella alpina]
GFYEDPDTSMDTTPTSPSESESESIQENGSATPNEFEVVKRKKSEMHLAMLPVEVFPNAPSLAEMTVAIKEHLRGRATIIGNMEITHINLEYSFDEHVVFQVASEAQLQAVLRAGFECEQEDGNPTRVYYQRFTSSHHKDVESRRVLLKAMAWNTKADDVRASMAAWGEIITIKMGFNAQKSMRTADVLFTSQEAVTKMIAEEATYVVIGRDVACVSQLGTTPVKADPKLTMKLTQLPPYFMPADVIRIFEAIPAPNKAHSCQGITMPVNVHTKRRLPEAFVYFDNKAQWDRANRVFTVDEKYKTAWVTPDTLTCRICTSAAHQKAQCPTLERRIALRQTRKNNTIAMQTTTHQPANRVAANNTTPISTTQKSNPATTTAAPSKGMSYSAMVKGKGKQVVKNSQPAGIAYSNPNTSTGKATGSSNTGPSHNIVGNTQTLQQAKLDVNKRLDELSKQLETEKQTWKSFRVHINQVISRVTSLEQRLRHMESKIDQVLQALTQTPPAEQVFEEDEVMSEILSTSSEGPSIILATPTNMLPVPSSTVSVIGKRSTDEQEDAVLAPVKPHTASKMDTHEQLQLKVNALKADLASQIERNVQATEMAESYKQIADEKQQQLEDACRRIEALRQQADAAEANDSDSDV